MYRSLFAEWHGQRCRTRLFIATICFRIESVFVSKNSGTRFSVRHTGKRPVTIIFCVRQNVFELCKKRSQQQIWKIVHLPATALQKRKLLPPLASFSATIMANIGEIPFRKQPFFLSTCFVSLYLTKFSFCHKKLCARDLVHPLKSSKKISRHGHRV